MPLVRGNNNINQSTIEKQDKNTNASTSSSTSSSSPKNIDTNNDRPRSKSAIANTISFLKGKLHVNSNALLGLSLYDDPSIELFRLCKSFNTQQEHQQQLKKKVKKVQIDKVCDDIHILLQHFPQVIHTVDDTSNKGYNALHLICQNPILVNNIKLIQLLVEISEIVVEVEIDDDVNIDNNSVILDKLRKKVIAKTEIKKIDDENNNNNNKNITEVEGSNTAITMTSNSTTARKARTIISDAKLIRDKTYVHGQTALHIACTNHSLYSIDTVDYLIQCYPASVCIVDYINKNLPLHCACNTIANVTSLAITEKGSIMITNGNSTNQKSITTTIKTTIISNAITIPSLELIILLVQHYPDSCKILNRDGNLPIHLLVSCVKPCLNKKESDSNDKSNNNQMKDTSIRDYFKFRRNNDNDDTNIDKNNNKNDQNVNKNRDDGSNDNDDESDDDDGEDDEDDEDDYEQDDDGNSKNQQKRIQQNLLEVIQYLVEMYPESLEIRNKQGLTPYQIALFSYSTSVATTAAATTSSIHHHTQKDVEFDLQCIESNLKKTMTSTTTTKQYELGGMEEEDEEEDDIGSHIVIQFLRSRTKGSKGSIADMM